MCYLYSYDKKDGHVKRSMEKIDVQSFRKIICDFYDKDEFVNILDEFNLPLTEYGMPENWKSIMQKNGQHCDNTFQQLTADYLQRDIVLISALFKDGHNERGEILIESHFKDITKQPLYLLYYHEGSFGQGHFQSIRPLTDFINGEVF